MTTESVEPIDLDAVLDRLRPPRPGEVTDPAEIAAIRARIAYIRLPWWRRLTTPTPPGWRPPAKGPVTP